MDVSGPAAEVTERTDQVPLDGLLGFLCHTPLVLRRAPSRFPLGVHEALAERALRRVAVVNGAQETHVFHRRLAAAGQRLDVVELDANTRGATPSHFVHEAAAAAIPLPDRSPDRGGD